MDTSRIAAVVVVVALSGCSMAISGPAKDRSRGELPKCDTGKGLVALDGVTAVGLGVAGLATVGADQKDAGLALLGLSAAFALAAYKGDSNASECRAAFAQYAQEVTPSPLDRGVARTSPVIEPVVSSGSTAIRDLPAAKIVTHDDATPVVEVEPDTPPPPPNPTAATTVPKPAATPAPKSPAKPATKPKQPAKWDDFWQEAP